MKYTSSPVDHRKLTMLAHTIARQHPGRREFVHGRIHEMDCRCAACRRAA